MIAADAATQSTQKTKINIAAVYVFRLIRYFFLFCVVFIFYFHFFV